MARPSVVLVVLPLAVLATLLATANAQDYTAPVPSPLPDTLSPPPPPPPQDYSTTTPPPASSPPPPSPPPPASSPPPPPPSPPPPMSSPPPPSPPPPASSPPPPSSPPPASSPPPPPPPASNWTPVANVNDPTIQQVAQFAVRIYALSTKELRMQLLSVISGETQPCDGGYNYRLVITVTGGKKTQYDAFVWGILGTMSWKLWSFTPHVV
ncbi:unnamed protein product [Urochloa decumbens]|uniref:Cystatin domain-containing protein n=1 Tax=Urochloa decumbens TaxID=240449 RepID=A0ABC8X7D4_9POAL